MTIAADRPPAPVARARIRSLVALGVSAVAIESLLLAGVLAPLRLDRQPVSLHVNLASALGTDTRGLALYLAVAGGLVACYWLALRAAGSAPRLIGAALAGSALFGATLIPAHPTYSSDVLHYMATARVAFAHGQNPHVVPPEAIAGDPLMPLSGWKWVPSPYGPAWTWLSALPFAASGGADDPTRAVVWFKVLAVVSLLGATAGVAVTAERLRPGTGTAATIAFGWNPVVLIHFAADGHNDAAMLCLLAWSMAALAAQRRALAPALAGGAVLIKLAAAPAAAGLALHLVRQREWRALALGTLAAAVAGVALLAPYWAGTDTFRAMLDEGRYFTTTPAALLIRALTPSLGVETAQMAVGGAIRVTLLAALVWLVLRARPTAEGVIGALAVVYVLAVTVLAGWYQPWYIAWPLLFLAMLVFRLPATAAALGLTAGALLVPVSTNFIAEMSGQGVHVAWVQALGTAFALVPVGVALALTWHRGPKPPAPVSSEQHPQSPLPTGRSV